MSELAELGIVALRQGHKDAALRLLTEAVARDPLDATAWLWLSGVVEDDDQRADCLRHVLNIEPDNAAAHAGLEQIKARQRAPFTECSTCGQVGRVTCPHCAGSCTELCSACQGQTFQSCSTCHGQGWHLRGSSFALSSSFQMGADEQWFECADCHATGFVECPACRGRGREWCHVCEGGGQIVCPDCGSARLRTMLGEQLGEAVSCAIRRDTTCAQTLLAGLQDSNRLASFLWRVGFAYRPYHSGRRLQAWTESHADDLAGWRLLALLPEVPYEQLPSAGKPVQLIKQLPPTGQPAEGAAPALVLPQHPDHALRDAIMAARIGNRDQALVLLLQAVQQEPHSEEAWLWLARLMDTDVQRADCLRRVLDINPGNHAALEDLTRLTGTSKSAAHAGPGQQ